MQLPPPSSAPDASAQDTTFLDSIRDPSEAPARIAEVAGAARDAVLDETLWIDLGWRGLKVILVIFLALLAIAIFRRIKERWVASVQDDPATDPHRQRVLTTADLLGSVARYVVWSITIVTVLSIVGFDIRALLAGAGIAGLAIGFGAQTLVKDVISGFFLLFDDTLGVGDLITFNGETATVEYVGLRLIKARKFDGELLMIPAGEMRTFGNKSVGFARVVVPVDLAYEGDVEAGLAAMEAVANEWAQTDFAKTIMLEEAPTVQAVTALGESSVTARIIVQVRPGEQFQAERELLRLIKNRFDETGVEIPFPRRTVYVKSDTPSSALDAAAAAGSE
ncbi:MAG: mechanosensitive ion channel family protein [Bacteroidota bacterium]